MKSADRAQLSDSKLVELCRKGDDEAFAVIYNRYRLPLFSYLQRLLPRQNDRIDDIFQQTWIKAVRNWHNYTDQQKLFAWLCRIAHNLTMDHFRNRSNAEESSEIPENVAADEPTPEDELNRQALTNALRDAIAKLPLEQQEMIRLRQDGLSFKEIAELKKLTLNTALGRMHYAVQNLKKLMANFLD